MNNQHPSSARSARRTGIRLLLVVWMVLLVAPCFHCLPLALGAPPFLPAGAPPAAAELTAKKQMPAEMPADCPMHKNAAPEPPAAPDCPKPSDCCLENGQAQTAVPEGVQPTAPPVVAALADLPPGLAAPLPSPLFLPRALGEQRSHAPPSFLAPLRI